MVVIVFGLPGSGKSYLAVRLSERLGARYLGSDQIRGEMIKQKTYSEKEKSRVYDEMLVRMKQLVRQKADVVLDATFYKGDLRKKIVQEVQPGTEFYFIEVVADEALIRERLQNKRRDSDADFDVYQKVKAQWEPMSQAHLMVKSTNDNIEELLHQAISYLAFNNDKRAST